MCSKKVAQTWGTKFAHRKCRASHEKLCATLYQCDIFFPKCFLRLRYILFVYTSESCFYCNRSYIHFSFYCGTHCVKRVRIQSFSGPFFPAFGLNTEKYRVYLCIQSECGKMWTRKTVSTDTFHVVSYSTSNVKMFKNQPLRSVLQESCSLSHVPNLQGHTHIEQVLLHRCSLPNFLHNSTNTIFRKNFESQIL